MEVLSRSSQFAGKVMTSYISNWFTLMLLCTSTPLVLCCDRFVCGKHEPVALVIENYDISLCQQILELKNGQYLSTINLGLTVQLFPQQLTTYPARWSLDLSV